MKITRDEPATRIRKNITPMKKRSASYAIDAPVTAGTAARIIGLTVQQFTAHVSAGIIPQAAPKRYHMPSVFQAYLRHAEANAPDAVREQVRRDTERERLNFLRASADLAEAKAERFAASYAPRDEIENALDPVFADFEKFLRKNFDGRFAAQCEGKTAPEIKAECQARIDDAITRVRNGASPELAAAEKEGKA